MKMTFLTLTKMTNILASLLTLGIAHAYMALPSLNRSLDQNDKHFGEPLLRKKKIISNIAKYFR